MLQYSAKELSYDGYANQDQLEEIASILDLATAVRGIVGDYKRRIEKLTDVVATLRGTVAELRTRLEEMEKRGGPEAGEDAPFPVAVPPVVFKVWESIALWFSY